MRGLLKRTTNKKFLSKLIITLVLGVVVLNAFSGLVAYAQYDPADAKGGNPWAGSTYSNDPAPTQPPVTTVPGSPGPSPGTAAGQATPKSNSNNWVSPLTDWLGNQVISGLMWFIYYFFTLEARLLGLFGFLFDWALNPQSYQVLNYQSVYYGWQMVRDFLNMFFILILLFSAFSTIFQVDRFSLRAVLLKLVIMALLVNFSFPITRFLIDMANVAMYFFLNSTFTANKSASAEILNFVDFAATLVPSKAPVGPNSFSGLLQLLTACVFIFIMAVTMGMLAVLLLIRLLVLTILLIFSPVGFVFWAIPGSAKSLSSKWWDKLFSQAFFGPIMAFMLLLATRLMQEIRINGDFKRTALAYTNPADSADTANFLANATIHIVPLVFLWLAVGVAGQMKEYGASAVVGAGMSAISWGRKNWLGSKYIFRAGGAAGGWALNKSGVNTAAITSAPKGVWQGLKARFVEPRKDEKQKWEERYKAFGKKGVAGYRGQVQSEFDKAVEKRAKDLKDSGTGASVLRNNLDGSDNVTAAASARIMADQKLISSANDLVKIFDKLGEHTEQKRKILESSDKGIIKNSDDFNKVHASLMKGIKDNPGVATEKDQKSLIWNALDKKLKDDNNAGVRAAALQNADIMREHGDSALSPQEAYKKVFGDMSADKFAEQKLGDLASKQEFRNYVQDDIATDPEYHQRLYSRLSSNEKRNWRSSGISPAVKKQGQDQEIVVPSSGFGSGPRPKNAPGVGFNGGSKNA